MFENEAKEKAKRKIYNFIVSTWGVSQIRTEQTCETVEGVPHFYQYSLEKMWQEGAEYGYKYKENEWHYIKNGDYPKDNRTVLALCIVGGEPYPYLAQYWKGSTTAKKDGVDLNWNCWLNNMQREVVEPYAWREITIPELGLQMPMQEG